MTAMDILRRIAAEPDRPPHIGITARAVLEARLGRKLGDLRALKRNEPDTYKALRLLALEHVKTRRDQS
jgi:hypothetical protein